MSAPRNGSGQKMEINLDLGPGKVAGLGEEDTELCSCYTLNVIL